MTTYNLKFERKAQKLFSKLGEPVKSQFKEKLRKVLENPHIEANRLYGALSGCYKIKLKQSGYRLVYKVEDGELLVLVLAIGKRERKGLVAKRQGKYRGRKRALDEAQITDIKKKGKCR